MTKIYDFPQSVKINIQSYLCLFNQAVWSDRFPIDLFRLEGSAFARSGPGWSFRGQLHVRD